MPQANAVAAESQLNLCYVIDDKEPALPVKNAREALWVALRERAFGDKRTRARAPATINRDIVPLRAALSKLLAPGAPNSNAT